MEEMPLLQGLDSISSPLISLSNRDSVFRSRGKLQVSRRQTLALRLGGLIDERYLRVSYLRKITSNQGFQRKLIATFYTLLNVPGEGVSKDSSRNSD